MTEPQEPTREIDMTKLLAEQAEPPIAPRTDGLAAEPRPGDAFAGDAAQ